MTFLEENYLSFTLVDKPFEDVAAVTIGVARALWGQLAVHQNDTRRPNDIRQDQAARLAPKRLLLPEVGLSISSAPNGKTFIENPLHEQISRHISKLHPNANVLSIESWAEGKVRVCQRMSFFSDGVRVRLLGANKGTLARGWTWEEDGNPTPWEDPHGPSKHNISQRLTRSDLFATAQRFGVDIKAALSIADKQAIAVEFLHLYDPDAPPLVSDDHFDLTQKAVDLGIGDPLHLEPPDFEGAKQLEK